MRWILPALLLMPQDVGRSRIVTYLDGQSVEILVPISTTEKHVATVVSFPEESIEAVVVGWNEADLSLERRRDNLFVKLLKKAEGDLHVLGTSGTLYRLYIKAADKVFDGQVRITRPSAPKGQKNSIDLARAMRLGGIPEGVTVRAANQVLWMNDGAVARAKYLYDATFYRGYVIEIRSSVAKRIDLSRFLSKDLVLVGARDMVIEPGGSTLLYLVFWK